MSGGAPARVKLIACEILARECHHAVSRARRAVDLELLQQGLHDLGAEGMRARLQEAVDAASGGGRYAEVLLGYGLCNNGVVGLAAREAPLVIPRVHDCISIFLGSAARYGEEFGREPGTYYYTAGWLERDKDLEHPPGVTVTEKLGMGRTFEQYAAEYGEENARYIVATLGEGLAHYTRIAFVEMGLGPEAGFEETARERAAKEGLRFEKMRGDLAMLRRLADGDRARGEFLVVPPGATVEADVAGGILRCSSRAGGASDGGA